MKDLCFGMHHAGVFTPDLRASEEFYRDVFGFEVVFHIDGGDQDEFNITFMEKDGLRIELVQPKDGGRDVRMEALDCLNHIAISCSDTKAAAAALREKGLQAETQNDQYVKDFGAPGRDIDILFLRGPAGERIEIYQEVAGNGGRNRREK